MESALRTGAGQPGLRLIETMLWDGSGVPRLALHRARLCSSAARLGWADPRRAMEAGLDGLRPPADPARLRLTLDASGRVAAEIHPLPPAADRWHVSVSPHRLRSDDPWLSVKSTNRALYDAARASLPAGVDEVIFLNERGEVAEGAITTVFFDRGQGLRTPPLHCGCLPGVLRAELAPAEEVLLAADLPSVQLWVGNALRGLIPARLAVNPAG